MRSALGLVTGLLLASSPAVAQSVQVNATLSESTVAIGDVVTMEIVASTNGNADLDIQVPNYGWVKELRRSQSESSQFSFTNAGQQMLRQRTLRIDFEAAKPGKYVMSSITARSGQNQASAGALPIEIVDSPAALAVPATPGQVAPPLPQEQGLFVRYRASKATAYLGEQVLLDLDIFTNGSFSLEEAKSPPALDGFWREIIDQPNRLVAREVNVGGQRMRAYRLWRVALFPLNAGQRTIPQEKFTFATNRGMFNAGTRLRRMAPPITLEILPLPTEGRPNDFASTNVGDYYLTATVDSQRVEAGKAILLRVRLSGRGNIKNARLPTITDVPGFRAFPPSVKDSVSSGDQGVSGIKEAEVILMPLKGGRLTVPSFALSTFSPSKGSYERLTTPSIQVFVEGNPASAPAGPPPIAGPDTTSPKNVMRAELKPLRFRSKLVDRNRTFATQPAFVALLVTPVALFIVLLVGGVIRSRLNRETTTSKRKDAERAAHARLRDAEEAAKNGDASGTYSQINEALLAYASEKSGVKIRGLTMEHAKTALIERGATQDLADRLITELENCDFARFAPGGQDDTAVADAIRRASDVLTELQQWTPQ